MKHLGIMTLNHEIPYKRPILKAMPCFVNAKGVLDEIERKHGGLYSNKESMRDVSHLKQFNKKIRERPWTSKTGSTLTRLNSAKHGFSSLSKDILEG